PGAGDDAGGAGADEVAETVSAGGAGADDAAETISASRAEAAHDRPPRLGNYRILGCLGSGGMGVVYEAEQISPRRRVALKVIRSGGRVDAFQLKLFQREANSLARLKHPGIAAIYETGQTEEGQQYFAMELAGGVTLDRYLGQTDPLAARTREGLRRRLRLFQQICDAVHYAHQRGVIHRDLKPTNILVQDPETADSSGSLRSREPVVKILDFGLARITDVDGVEATMTSESGRLMGTLAYMSPEQAGGDPDEVDVRTDVYSLGVILYEMLFGERPYDTSQGSLVEALRVIREAAPRAPRELRSGAPRVDADLETICLKALEKEADRRYPSAAALSEDVERFLTSQPILARPPSTVYQLKKLIRRRKGAFAFVSTFLLLLIAFAATMSVMFEQQRRERIRADAERDKAQEINAFLNEMLASVDPQAKGRDVTVREVLDDADRRIETRLADQPEVQASIRSTIGVAYEALGNLERAESQFRAALETRRQLFGEMHLDVAASMNDLAIYLRKTGDLAAAEPHYRRALEIREALLEPDDPMLAESTHNLGAFLHASGKLAEAESYMARAQTIFRKAYGAEHPIVILSLLSLAQVRQERGIYTRAESTYAEAVGLARRVHGAEHPTLGHALNGLGSLQQMMGDYAASVATNREALEVYRIAYGEDHYLFAKSLNNLGLALIGQREYAEAESLLLAALALRRSTLGDDHSDIAITLNNLALLHDDQGDYARAADYFSEALEIRQRHLGPEHPGIAQSLNNLATCLQALGDHAAAESLCHESLAMARNCLRANHPAELNYQRELADMLTERGAQAEAIALYEEMLGKMAEADSPSQFERAMATLGLGTVLARSDRAAEAEAPLRRAVELLAEQLSPGDPGLALAHCRLGNCLLELGRREEADSLLTGWSAAVLDDARTPQARKQEVRDALTRLTRASADRPVGTAP
ncbi:MAG: tetratricopeptide repeat protein, partial [Candidatus Eisenbacteria bacterium]|nr:tetratricopeptide repeat protein [Candidatus Eisenbacteria bacterium]